MPVACPWSWAAMEIVRFDLPRHLIDGPAHHSRAVAFGGGAPHRRPYAAQAAPHTTSPTTRLEAAGVGAKAWLALKLCGRGSGRVSPAACVRHHKMRERTATTSHAGILTDRLKLPHDMRMSMSEPPPRHQSDEGRWLRALGHMAEACASVPEKGPLGVFGSGPPLR